MFTSSTELAMFEKRTRRGFLCDVGKGMVVAAIGSELALDMGLADGGEASGAEPLAFGDLEALVSQLQETSISKLNSLLVSKINGGIDLKTLIAAGALANARTFGGEDYVGFHTMMALGPAYHMSRELPAALAPLPVMKVLYRNTRRIQEQGGRSNEVLHAVSQGNIASDSLNGDALRQAVHDKDMNRAEQIFAGLVQRGDEEALNALLEEVQEKTEVHRVVLPYRAWDMLDLIGHERAHTLLRQSVRYCVKAESWPAMVWDQPRSVLPALMEKYKLMDRQPGTKLADDAMIDKLSQTIFKQTAQQSAETAASILADGFAPDVVGEAISLAANQIILRDHGRTPRDEVTGKPMGSVHGDSIGVHACDSANAWRNLARVASPRNTFACLMLGAFQVALDRVMRGGDFLEWEPMPLKQHLAGITAQEGPSLLAAAEEAIRGNLQAHAAAIVERYGQLGHPARPMFDLMLKYAVSEDGALHAEKYYRTVSEEFARTRPTFRWRQLVALARVTASEYGRPADGMAEAREMLKV